MNKLKIKSNQWLSRHVPLPTNPIPVLHKPFPISIPYEFTKNIIIIGDQLETDISERRPTCLIRDQHV